MAKRETLKPNEVSATLFVGVGGIGSRIIGKVAKLSVGDKMDNVRFVTLDTDVNDIERLPSGAVISSVQTSSPRTIKDYLKNDKAAKNHWFPENKILDDKTVSEGAGQVRAISRLAINASIRQGKVSTLYRAIDELFLKDGRDKNQAIKVVVCSTAAGGTGSGIAMITGMLIRNYIHKNYPESGAIIRGFLLMPGVLDTVIDTESERQSLRRNGYATIKEINAFMMKASGFIDSNPELRRYRDLHVTVPTTSAGNERLENLPFDFCFLLDRTDENQRSMMTLAQYEAYAAQSIYEQNIGPMRGSASSKEDNVVREFIVPEKLGRCRFGGVGASVLVYPYDAIRDYIAYSWTQKNIFGKNGRDDLSEEDKKKLVANSWLKYDDKYYTAHKEWENDPSSSAVDEPQLADIYIESIENNCKRGSGDDFTISLCERYLNQKLSVLTEDDYATGKPFGDQMTKVIEKYFKEILDEAIQERVLRKYDVRDENGDVASGMLDSFDMAKSIAVSGGLQARYSAIRDLEDVNDDESEVIDVVRKYAEATFKSDNSIKRSGNAKYMLTSFLSQNGNAMHPNAARYLLYKLLRYLEEEYPRTAYDKGKYLEGIDRITKEDTERFKVPNFFKKEESLMDMCYALDDPDIIAKLSDNESLVQECNDMLGAYANHVIGHFTKIASRVICEVAIPYLSKVLLPAYESFYKNFEVKAVGVEKQKNNIVDSLRFRNGDCVMNLFSNRKYLDKIVEQQSTGSGADAASAELFGDIYDAICKNARIAERTAYDAFSNEIKIDIFDEIIVGKYKEAVEKHCADGIDKDIFQAMRMEYEIKCIVEKEEAADDDKDAIAKRAKDDKLVNEYIKKTIAKTRNLASPGITKNDFDESREVSAVAYSTHLRDGNGIRIAEYLDAKNASESVSKYELHFFRSIYNVTPIQISKLCAPDEFSDSMDINDATSRNGMGDYFKAYQTYMKDIGPDSRLNAVITPHIDKRWNSISVMPELDLNYQRSLMKNIHQALFYGFVYGIIERYVPSEYDPAARAYRYRDGRKGFKKLIVSNGTNCDKLYEVLDALYFDRAAVSSIHEAASAIREKDKDNSISYKNTTFVKNATALKRTNLVCLDEIYEPRCPICGETLTITAVRGGQDIYGCTNSNCENFEKDTEPVQNNEERNFAIEKETSVFELPVLYFNSLPANKKDAAEIEIMIDAIIDAIKCEVTSFSEERHIESLLGKLIVKHFNLLVDNYQKFPQLLGKNVDILSNDVMLVIRKKVEDKLIELNRSTVNLKDFV